MAHPSKPIPMPYQSINKELENSESKKKKKNAKKKEETNQSYAVVFAVIYRRYENHCR